MYCNIAIYFRTRTRRFNNSTGKRVLFRKESHTPYEFLSLLEKRNKDKRSYLKVLDYIFFRL